MRAVRNTPTFNQTTRMFSPDAIRTRKLSAYYQGIPISVVVWIPAIGKPFIRAAFIAGLPIPEISDWPCFDEACDALTYGFEQVRRMIDLGPNRV